MNKYDYMARLREPSTWAALAILGAFFGPQYADPGFQSQIVAGGVAFSGVLAGLIPEKKD